MGIEIAEKYVKLVHSIFRLRKKNLNTHSVEQMALLQIAKNENITPMHLANELSLTPQTMSGVISTLEQKNFIVRELSKKDKRKFLLIATEEGKQEAKNIKQKYIEEVTLMFDHIGEEDVKHLIRIYEKILEFYSEVK